MQSWQTCALSGELIETPVISRVSGHIYEKRLIEKHIESTGTCPITGRPLNIEDLIEVKVAKIQKPRPVTATSIPSVLSLLQNEWDALLLEQFQLKQQLEQVRHELTHALYQHDAACRVISRVMQERDQARIELAQIQQKLGAKIEIEAEKNADKLPANIISDITQTTLKLSNQRKASRKLPNFFDQFPTPEILSNYDTKYQQVFQQSLNKVDINRDQTNIIVLGGQNGQVILHDINKKSDYFNETIHQDEITAIQFIYIDQFIRFVSSSSDGYLIFYKYEEGNMECKKINIKQNIVGVSIHPIQYLVVVCCQNGLIQFYDARNQTLISQINDFEDQLQFSSIAIHPDGHFIALGQTDGNIKIWSTSKQALLTQLEGQSSPIKQMIFSESGVQLASVAQEEIVLWNLRNSEIQRRLFEGQKIGGICYDKSGQYLAVGLQKCINLVKLDNFESFCKIESHRDLVNGISFGENQIVTCSTDKQVNVYRS